MDNEQRILNRLDKLSDSIGEIGVELGKNSAQHEALGEKLDTYIAESDKIDVRVDVLESFKTKIVAYSTLVAILAGGVFKLVL